MTRRTQSEGLYRTAQVAKILGVSSRTLYRMLLDGRLDEPMRHPANGYRMWTGVDMQEIRARNPLAPIGKGAGS